MGETLLGIIIGAVPTGAAALLGWARWLHEMREKRKERAAKDRAEAELKTIRRRSLENCPYIVLSEKGFHGKALRGDEPGQLWCLSRMDPNVVSTHQRAIKPNQLPDGAEVFLIVENIGRVGVGPKLNLDGIPVHHSSFVETPALYAFRYPYVSELQGKEQTLELSFLSMSGVRDVHRYRTQHGIWFLERIDPS